jgi:hypothetical protein
LGEETQVKKAAHLAQQQLGKLIWQHAAKIAIGLGAIFVLVWDVRGDMDARDQRLKVVEAKAAAAELLHKEDNKALRRKIRRLERTQNAILIKIGGAQSLPFSPAPDSED